MNCYYTKEEKALNIKRVLKKEGIEIVNALDTLTINNLATQIAGILSSSFPNLNLDSKELFINISRLNMYFAKLPNRNFSKIFCKKQVYIF